MLDRTTCCDQMICSMPFGDASTHSTGGRIAMLSVHTCPLAMLGGRKTGGMNVYVRELSRELGRRGWAVDIFTHAESLTRPAVVRLGHNVRVVHVVAGPVRHVGRYELYHYLPEFAQNVVAFAEAQGLSYDLIHSHYWLSGLVASRLRRTWGVPFVQMFHTLGALKNQVAESEADREREVRIESEAHLMRLADFLVAATPFDRHHMIAHYGADPRNVRVIPCGVNLKLFRPLCQHEARAELGLSPASRILLYVGRIEPLKGVETLLQAMALLVARRPMWRSTARLLIVGGQVPSRAHGWPEEMARLHRLRAFLGLSDVVTFFGAQDQETLPYFYAAADVVVVPSHYESFGLVALEAMACGTPVVASRVGGLAYTVQDGKTGFLVPPKVPEALAHRLETLLDNPTLRHRLGRNGVQRARRFGWSAVADRVEALYRRVQPRLTGQPYRHAG
ncbi:MAG: glycosyltransferase [Ardenticatenia bacterium]|nr:glycosyltransferase [Ardenticatenia bacterium]